MGTVFLILWCIGILTTGSSVFFLKPGVPVRSLNPKNWEPIWKQKDNFKGPGYALMIVGYIWMFISAIGLLVHWAA